jgi:hypothetical protein
VGELRLEFGRVERNARHFAGIQRIHHYQRIGKHRHLVDGFGQPQYLEHAEYVRPKLDAGACLAQFVSRSMTMLSSPWRASASAAANPPMPPPAMRNGFMSLLRLCPDCITGCGAKASPLPAKPSPA